MWASIGVFLFPALRMLFSNRVITFSGFAILIWYYIELPLDITSQSVRFRHFVLMVATFLMLFWTPFVKIKISNRNIWEWTQNLLISFIASILFSILLFIGITLALFSIEKLFDVVIPSIRYAQIAIVIFGIYGVNLFYLEFKYIILLQDGKYTRAEEVFTKYILFPLTIG